MHYEILFLLIIVALCYFETILSRLNNKLFGLILPTLTFIALTTLTIIWTLKAETFSFVSFIVTFIFTNIPTIILLLIYYFGRKKRAKKIKK